MVSGGTAQAPKERVARSVWMVRKTTSREKRRKANGARIEGLVRRPGRGAGAAGFRGRDGEEGFMFKRNQTWAGDGQWTGLRRKEVKESH